MTVEVIVSLGGHEWKSTRGRLGKYLSLFEVNKSLGEAANRGDTGGITDSLYEYLSLCNPDLTRDLFDSAPWFEVLDAYESLRDLNAIPQAERYAVLSQIGGEKIKPPPWDYRERLRVVYVHLIASVYGWGQEQILDLWPEEAIAYIQEILVDDQFEREFQHVHSEMSYTFDKATKKSKYMPLERPAWMVLGTVVEQELRRKDLVTKIHRDMLPAGVVLSRTEK